MAGLTWSGPESRPAAFLRSGHSNNTHLRTLPLIAHTLTMTTKPRLNRWFGWLAALPLLTGCAAKTPTFEEAADAVRKCGMSPDDVLWRVTEKGQVMFGRKDSNAPAPSFDQVDCFMRWATENKVQVGIVGREANGS